jgi:signal transduction histidine kinase
LRELATRFNAMAVRIESLVDAQRQFVADASHELRTPLTALRLRLDTMADAPPDELPAEISAAARESTRLQSLVEGLLTLARAEGRTPAPVVVDLAAIARERAETWRPLAAEQEVTFAVDGAEEAAVRAVDGAAEQVLDNFLANALDVAPAGSTITIRVVAAGDAAELHVIDEGPGLSEEARTRAFDRFWRSPDAASGGTGLGLAIVRQLTTASGGGARLDRAPSGGIDAIATFPIAR